MSYPFNSLPAYAARALRPVSRRLATIRGLRRVTHWFETAFAGAGPVVIEDFDGQWRFECHLSEHMGAQIFWRGAYSGAQLRELHRYLPRDGVFIDAGANQGEFTVTAAGIVRTGHVYAFEPAPWMHERLQRNLALNEFRNVTVVPYGLSDARAVLAFYDEPRRETTGPRNEGLISLYPDARRSQPVGQFSVIALDEWAAEAGLSRLDVLKADVEGAELRLLQGAAHTLERFRPALLLECSDASCRSAGYSAGELVAHLRSALRYRVSVVEPRGVRALAAQDPIPTFCNLLCLPA
jgi:FkbM family methyltransferase